MKRLTIFLVMIFTFKGFACSPFVAFSRSEPPPAEPVIAVTQEAVIGEPATLPAPTETPIQGPAFTATT